MPTFCVTYRDYSDPDEPSFSEMLEAQSQDEAMKIGRQHAFPGREIVGLAPKEPVSLERQAS